MAHDDKHHFGEGRMMEDLSTYQMSRKTFRVKKYVAHCPACKVNTTDRSKPNGDYQPIRPEDSLPMRSFAIDYIVRLPKVSSACTLWQLQGKDKDYYDTLMTFTSRFWKGLWKSLGTRLLMTTAYHPQGDGASEQKNQTVEIAIRYHHFMHPELNWVDLMPQLQWNLNSAYTDLTKSSVHEQLFGYKLRGPNDATRINTDSFGRVRFLRDHLRKDAELAMDFASARHKRLYDNKHKIIEFREGDEVYLRLYKGYHLPGHPLHKYSQQRAGPWKVKKRVGRLAYEIDLPDIIGVHPVISVAQLSPGPDGEDPFHRTVPPPGPVEAEEDDNPDGDPGDLYEIEIILKHELNAKKIDFKYLIKWKGYGHDVNGWKTERQLRKSPLLLEEYWQRQGGRITIQEAIRATNKLVPNAIKNPVKADTTSDTPAADNAPIKRPRGRPRKDTTPVPAPITGTRKSTRVRQQVDKM
ncbi:Uu.00g032840.m01.CDS01 [Anthostomella pinea]|uniref:Uu.00g032840.m01.CDS01 n=1 Tax=Anthostomella pinea TaxID=933095 RepID=A0AAI8YD45_9PEZI|nr:Uu.00g032840.m01.CDS01 [Anthostomella pinea]